MTAKASMSEIADFATRKGKVGSRTEDLTSSAWNSFLAKQAINIFWLLELGRR